jgi:hypothetical protein
MKDIREHVEKLRLQIAECEMVKNLATDPKKQELFGPLAEHFRVLAGELETEIAKRLLAHTVMGSGTQEPSPK